MKKLYFILLTTICSISFAQVSFNKNGVADIRPKLFAFTNATIVVDSKTTIENATLIVKNDLIEAVGKNITIPKGAIIYDLSSKRIYPSFIEAYSDYGLPEIKRAPARGFGGPQQIETNTKGAYATNQALKPEVDATSIFVVDSKKAEEMRKIGFGSALIHSMDGIMRGNGAIVLFGDGKEHVP